MALSIVNERFQLHLENTNTEMDLVIPGYKPAAENIPSTGSALQTPDISRIVLAGLLRRAGQDRVAPGQNWAAFLTRTAASCANAN